MIFMDRILPQGVGSFAEVGDDVDDHRIDRGSAGQDDDHHAEPVRR